MKKVSMMQFLALLASGILNTFQAKEVNKSTNGLDDPTVSRHAIFLRKSLNRKVKLFTMVYYGKIAKKLQIKLF